MASKSTQDLVQHTSLSDPERFWTHHASHLHWHKPPTSALQLSQKTLPDGTRHRHWTWFPGGEISTTYNCVDRHVKEGRGGEKAIVWDSPVTGMKGTWTYGELLEEVEVLAGVLSEEGVGRGDVVLIYMPMIPAAIFAMLATVRLGAMHAVVFGGFAAASLAQRIEAARPKVIMTASCAVEGAKGPLEYRSFVEGAIEMSKFKPEKTVIWQREEKRWDPVVKERGQRNWQRLVKSARGRGVRAKAVPVRSDEGVYIIYTSGTTGLPKGVLRQAAGHAVVGHSYIVYAPLLAGATTVLFEGKPIGTPDAGSFWRIVEEHKVTSLFTAPTALRAIKKDDPESHFLSQIGRRGGLRHWRALFLAGERSEPSIIRLYQDLLSKHAAPGATVIDNWWSSESGSPMTGIALRPDLGLLPDQNKNAKNSTSHQSLQVKPGSAGKPLPGFSIHVVSDSGSEVPAGEMGNIVLATPLAPTGFTTLFNDAQRYYRSYLKRFEGRGDWIDTGDAGMMDEEGYVHVMSRSDDVINVAAHRFSTGHLPFAFITPSSSSSSSSPSSNSSSSSLPAKPPTKLFTEVNHLVREQIGAIATLGGMIQGKGMIPRTRSGKTLRRVLRELVENAVEIRDGEGEGGRGVGGSNNNNNRWEKWDEVKVNVPATVEDAGVVEVARGVVREYFENERNLKEGKGKGGEKAKL
ncbi:MAG: hypothetical protein Q9227_006254 [Pyrenula ochraceoflavens]